MSRVKSKDTGIELLIRSELVKLELQFITHPKELPGKPDIVFPSEKVVVFIDGDYWHGYRFPVWKHTLSPFWYEKIGKTRRRDQRNFRKLRRMGWTVIRIWQHQIQNNLPLCVSRIVSGLSSEKVN